MNLLIIITLFTCEDIMIDLHFSSIQGENIVHSKYTIKPYNHFMYIQPAKNFITKKINPLEDIDTLIMDILDTAQVISSCKKYMQFLSKISENTFVFEKHFWRYPDFFENKNHPEAITITNALLVFVEKYGLPEWELERDTKAILPPEYCINSSSKSEYAASNDYLKTFLTDKIAQQEKVAFPVCSLTLFFLDFYNIFTINRTSKLKRVEHCRLFFRNEPGKEPELTAAATGLKPSIILAFITFTTGHHKAVHICKHCGKHFITTDARSEYCSPKCRASYNTAQSRKRQKRQGKETF